jgi:hypothetical protein
MKKMKEEENATESVPNSERIRFSLWFAQPIHNS